MNSPTPHPTETSLGTSSEREDLLQQQAHNSRVARWVRAIARVAFVLLVVGILAATVVGPGRAIDWVGTYLFPVATILAVGFCVFLLLVQLTKRLPTGRDLSDWWQ